MQSLINLLLQLALLINSFWLGISPTISQYTEGVLGQPRSFLPSQTETQNDKTISGLIYRSLFKYDNFGTLIPDLAETWSISEDSLVYTLKLKDDQYWSNGAKITANDLIYTSYKVQNLVGVATDRVNELTVRFTLPNKYSPFLNLLTIEIMPESAEENMDPLKPVTSGPFHVVRVEKNGPIIKRVVLVHENQEQSIRKLSFRYYVNEDELVTAAKLGEIEGFISDSNYDIENFKQLKFPLQGVYFALFFNLRDEKLQDLTLRQDLAKVLPLEQLNFNRGISVQGAVSRSSYTNKGLEFDYYDEGFEADYGDLTLRIVVPDIKIHKKTVENIAHIWEDKLEMEVKIIEVDPETILEDIIQERRFEILFYGQEIGRDPDRYVNWHSTQKDHPGLNISGFEQVRADRALEEGRNEPDTNARLLHYNEFQKVIIEEVPAIFLYHPFSKYYLSKYIDGVGEKYTFSVGDRFLDFTNWEKIKTN